VTAAKICVLGPSGRMGRAVIDAAAGRHEVSIVSAVDRKDAPGLGALVGRVVATADAAAGLDDADVYVDFTSPAATREIAELARARKKPAVIGTTGLDRR
jgi:4-hydroxy-tetrahydrodipicolinate reductase